MPLHPLAPRRFFASFVLHAVIVGWFSLQIAFVMAAVAEHDNGQLAIWVFALLVSCVLMWRTYRKLNFTLEVWKEAIVVIIKHPTMALLVPFLELVFQMYQIWLLSFQMCLLHKLTYGGVEISTEAALLSAWVGFMQYLTLFTVRSAFEVGVAGTVCKNFFRAEDGSEDR